MNDEPTCSNCGIPLQAVEEHDGDRCADREACAARRFLGKASGGGALISPEGVTRVTPPE